MDLERTLCELLPADPAKLRTMMFSRQTVAAWKDRPEETLWFLTVIQTSRSGFGMEMVQGSGATLDQAIERLKKNMADESMWQDRR